MRLFTYRVARDYGFAPNPFHGFCTLATCKPQIRKFAQSGDLVVGCGSVELGNPEKIVYIMRVDETLTFQQYWDRTEYGVKKPSFTSSHSRGYGDNIYHQENGEWVQADSHHSHEGGLLNLSNLKQDMGANVVLVSRDFTYWGSAAIDIPAHLRNFDGEDLFPSPRGRRSHYDQDFINAVDSWFRSIPVRGYLARPTSW